MFFSPEIYLLIFDLSVVGMKGTGCPLYNVQFHTWHSIQVRHDLTEEFKIRCRVRITNVHFSQDISVRLMWHSWVCNCSSSSWVSHMSLFVIILGESDVTIRHHLGESDVTVRHHPGWVRCHYSSSPWWGKCHYTSSPGWVRGHCSSSPGWVRCNYSSSPWWVRCHCSSSSLESQMSLFVIILRESDVTVRHHLGWVRSLLRISSVLKIYKDFWLTQYVFTCSIWSVIHLYTYTLQYTYV